MKLIRKPEPWHRKVVGGLWDELGRLQLDFLCDRGLTPAMSVLDIGCGSLRAGVHLIDYLDAGKYVGVDRVQALLDAGRDLELDPATLTEKRPLLVQMSDFDFSRLGRRFDVALAQSLFTHLPLHAILRCLIRARPVLNPGGRLYATFFDSGPDPLARVRQHKQVTTTLDADPYHQPLSFYEWAAAQAGLRVEYVGDWRHPRNQRMLAFR